VRQNSVAEAAVAPHELALIPCGIRQGFCVGDREKIVNHSSWSNYRCCSLISRVNDHERVDEAKFQGEFNGVPGRREQPNQ
jgi:hypothetical protein